MAIPPPANYCIPTTQYELKPVREKPERMQIVGQRFGVDSDIYKRIQKAEDCTCRIAYLGQVPKGMIVIADTPKEKVDANVKYLSLKIYALSLFSSELGIGSSLLQFAKVRAAAKNADAMHATIKQSDQGKLQAFLQNGFQLKGTSATGECALLALLKPQIAKPVMPPLLPLPSATAQTNKPATTMTEQDYLPMPLKIEYLNLIKQGKKTVEGRLNKGVFGKARMGNRFCFYSGDQKVYCKVKDVQTFRSFRDMLQTVGIEKCLPGVNNLDVGVSMYDRIPGYAAGAAQFGVVALHLEVEPSPNLNQQSSQSTLDRRRQREDDNRYYM